MTKATRPKLVRYISPFGSPAWMTLTEARLHLLEDDQRWLNLCSIERDTGEQVLSDDQRQVGAPRIES